MMHLIRDLVSHVTGSGRTPAAVRPRRDARPALEALEDRQLLSGTPLSADADRSLTTPTAAWVYHGVDANFLTGRVQQDQARISDLEVESTGPTRFGATLIKNTGVRAQGWWWYTGLTAADVAAKVSQHQARITDLERYTDGGQDRFAVVLTPNTGAANKAWGYYMGVDAAFVSSHLGNKRIVDLDRSDATGKLDVVMVANTGNDARQWWWYSNISGTALSTAVTQNSARITDVERQSNGNFSAVMEKSQGEHWWYYNGISAQQMGDLAGRNGARITDVEPYTVGGQKRFSVVMLNNSTDLTTRVGDLLREASPVAQVGAYLKKVGGPVLANLQGDRRFEPASMIKALIHLHALKQVQLGNARLTDTITYYEAPGVPAAEQRNVNPDSYAHTAANARTTTLENGLRLMMEQSDNRLTQAIQDRFGRPAINATAVSLGLSQTVLASTLGSGVAGNYFTLADAGRLYETVANGNAGVTGANRDKFYQLMNDGVSGTLRNVVREEAARRLNKPAGDAAVTALTNSFVAQMRQASKGGGYTLSASSTQWREIRTVGGYVEVPFKQGTAIVRSGYTYGTFVENALSQKSDPTPARQLISTAMAGAEAELLRAEIRAALATW